MHPSLKTKRCDKFKDVLAHLAPLQVHDLAAPTPGEEKEADDIGIWSTCRAPGHPVHYGFIDRTNGSRGSA